MTGGCCVTEEIAPGCRASTTSYIASMLRPEVIRALDLGRHGLRMVPCEPALQVALDGGEVLADWNDPARTAAGIARYSPADARAFASVHAELRRAGRPAAAAVHGAAARTPGRTGLRRADRGGAARPAPARAARHATSRA